MSYSTTVSLNAATGTGAGSSVVVPAQITGSNNVGVWLTYTGTPTTTSTTLQASVDGSTWVTVGSAMTGNTAQTVAFTVPPGAALVRLNLGTLSGGTAPTVTGLISFDTTRRS